MRDKSQAQAEWRISSSRYPLPDWPLINHLWPFPCSITYQPSRSYLATPDFFCRRICIQKRGPMRDKRQAPGVGRMANFRRVDTLLRIDHFSTIHDPLPDWPLIKRPGPLWPHQIFNKPKYHFQTSTCLSDWSRSKSTGDANNVYDLWKLIGNCLEGTK